MASKNRPKFLSGQSLVEVVVSVGIAVMLAISLITTSLITQKSARSARNNSQATKLVQQTLEQLRVFRDRAGFSGLPSAPTTTVCADFNIVDANNPSTWAFVTPVPACPYFETIPDTIFSRQIEFLNQGNEKRLITVTVRWDESGQTRTVKSQTFLSLWQEFP